MSYDERTREFIRDHYNREVTTCEVLAKFDLKFCDKCHDNCEKTTDLIEIDGEHLCESCRSDRDI